jgi:hypothetical protein
MRATRRDFFPLSFLACSIFFMCLISTAHAQLELPNMDQSIFITVVPENPKPGETVRLYAESVFYDLTKENNVWAVNGKTIAQGVGIVEASFTAGALGSRSAVVFSSGDASARTSITVTEVDLLFESNSYVPPFYRGRALPSEGSSVLVMAVPRLLRADGSFVAASSLTYTWKRNGSTIVSASGKGKFVATFPSPVLFGTDTISVDVRTSDGSLTGSASTNVSSVRPLLLLYEDHPLFGVTYHKALGAETFVPESEATFIAVPYFASVASPNDTSLMYDWVVNDQPIPPDTVKRSAITISSAGYATGDAFIRLNLSQSQNPFFSAHGEWNISFSTERSGGGSNAPVKNPFLPQ